MKTSRNQFVREVSKTQFFDECSQDQRLINDLITRNKELEQALKDSAAASLAKPNFLQELLQHSVDNRGKSKYAFSYTNHMKDVSLYLYVMSGPLVYKKLSKNLNSSMPSLATVRKMLASKNNFKEGHFRFDDIKGRMVVKGEPMYVVVAEDDTKTVEGLIFDPNSNLVMGLQMPLNDDGVPIHDAFKFTTLAAVQEYLLKNPLSS